MVPKLPGLDPMNIDDLLDQHMKFYGGMTSHNLLRSLPQRLLQSALPQQAQPAQPAQPPATQSPPVTSKS